MLLPWCAQAKDNVDLVNVLISVLRSILYEALIIQIISASRKFFFMPVCNAWIDAPFFVAEYPQFFSSDKKWINVKTFFFFSLSKTANRHHSCLTL